MAYAHFFSGRYDAAAASASEALRERPNYLTALRVASASQILAGRLFEGRQLMTRICQLDPRLHVSGLGDILPFGRGKDSAKWAGALHTAGCLIEYERATADLRSSCFGAVALT